MYSISPAVTSRYLAVPLATTRTVPRHTVRALATRDATREPCIRASSSLERLLPVPCMLTDTRLANSHFDRTRMHSQLQGSRSRFTWRQFREESWVELMVAVGVFALGLGIAATVFIMLGRWQGRHAPPSLSCITVAFHPPNNRSESQCRACVMTRGARAAAVTHTQNGLAHAYSRATKTSITCSRSK